MRTLIRPFRPSIRVTLLRRVPLLGMTVFISLLALSLFALSSFDTRHAPSPRAAVRDDGKKVK